ncbi:MAG TPA: HEAT repeat domain-containing protein [Pirellulales bacterium]|nr:HEAT repeat domain-containing protein [Pirellulales bacterium]
MNGRFSGRRARWLLSIAGVATGAAVWFVGSSLFDRLVAWKWRCQIDEVDDRVALGEVGRIAGLGEAGLPELAALLGSERLCVAEAARQALAEEMRRWPHLDRGARRQRQSVVAAALAYRIETFSPDARCVASDFALRILNMVPATDPEESEIVAACDQVLRASAVQRRQRLLARRPGSNDGNAGRGSAEFEANRAPRLASLPGGGLLPDDIDTPPTPVETVVEKDEAPLDDRREMASNEPARLAEPTAEQMNPTAETDAKLEAAAATLHHHATPTGEETEEDASDEAAAVLRWMFALRATDPAHRQRAEEELRGLGFEALQLELAMQLTDPNPTVRRELVESLPAMPGVDAKAWLVWLSRDANPDVRLAAMSVMATTGDPNIWRRIEQMARRDDDPRVQRQGEQLLKVLQADTRTSIGGARPRAQ